jgi:hypothetical protein
MRALLLVMLRECALRHARAASVAGRAERTRSVMLEEVAILVANREVRITSLIDALHLQFVYLTAQLVVDRTAEVRVRGLRRSVGQRTQSHALFDEQNMLSLYIHVSTHGSSGRLPSRIAACELHSAPQRCGPLAPRLTRQVGHVCAFHPLRHDVQNTCADRWKEAE